MHKEIKNIIEHAKSDKNVLAVAIFGSYARKETYRDIDICIFLVPKLYSSKELSDIKLIYASEDEKIDVQIFQQLPLYIKKRILKEAKIQFCRDDDMLYDIYFETIRDFEHFKHRYESYLEAVENG